MWIDRAVFLGVWVALVAGCGLEIPSTLGLRCNDDSDCDSGQTCNESVCSSQGGGAACYSESNTIRPETCNTQSDGSNLPGECSLLQQDCPTGLKCVVSVDLNVTKCVFLGGLNEPEAACESVIVTDEFGQEFYGDDCEINSVCFIGRCVETCGCSYATPSCSDARYLCDGIAPWPFCLEPCNLFEQDCPTGYRCLSYGGGPFGCYPLADELPIDAACSDNLDCTGSAQCVIDLEGNTVCKSSCALDGSIECPPGEGTCVGFEDYTGADACLMGVGACSNE